MEDKKLNEQELEQVVAGGEPYEHNVMLNELPKDIDPDVQTGDLEKVKDNGKLL